MHVVFAKYVQRHHHRHITATRPVLEWAPWGTCPKAATNFENILKTTKLKTLILIVSLQMVLVEFLYHGFPIYSDYCALAVKELSYAPSDILQKSACTHFFIGGRTVEGISVSHIFLV